MDDATAISELFRVLKIDVWALRQLPVDLNRNDTFEDPHIVSPSERERMFGQWDHVRVYGHDFTDRVAKAGFKVNVDGYVKELGEELVHRYGLDPTESIYFCTNAECR